MDIMIIAIGIISALFTGSILSYAVLRNINKEIYVKYRLDRGNWFAVHFTVYIITVALMLLGDMICWESSNKSKLPIVVYLVIRNGGSLIVVIIVSAMIYQSLLKISNYNYFVKRNRGIKKLFFSLICISLAFMYTIEIKYKSVDETIMLEIYSAVITWTIAAIQIWIGFGMDLYGIKDIGKCIKRFFTTKRDKEEQCSRCICVSSMFVAPIITIGYLICENEGVLTGKVLDIIKAIYYGFIAGAIIVTLFLFILNEVNKPCKIISMVYFNRRFKNVKNKKLYENFMGVQYAIIMDSGIYKLYICEKLIELDDELEFTEEYLDEIKKIFGKRYKEYPTQAMGIEEIKGKIIDSLIETAEGRTALLKKGWDMAYESWEKKELEKVRDNIGL